jgi:hypothetical protein
MKLLSAVSMIVSLGIATAAHAQSAPGETAPTTTTTTMTNDLPAPGGWSTDVRIGVPATFTDTGVVLGMANFQLGVGKRVGDRWYLGGTAEWTLGMNLGDDAASVTSSLRGGAEARYIFHTGTASVSTNGDEGPFYDTQRYDWIGLRGGVQSVSGADGAFGEVSLGFDAKVSDSFQFGMYVAAGVNLEPAGAYGTPSMSDGNNSLGAAHVVNDTGSSSYVTSPYVSLGWDLTFG